MVQTESDLGCTGSVDSDGDSSDEESLKCFDCDVSFTAKYYLYNHLLHHIKQPQILLKRAVLEPIKITLAKSKGQGFEIISSPQASPKITESTDSSVVATDKTSRNLADSDLMKAKIEEVDEDYGSENAEEETEANVSFSPNFVNENHEHSDSEETEQTINTAETEHTINTAEMSETPEQTKTPDYTNVPGAEPTPPPEPSPEYPKIRIKTSGLLMKESLTITEITDENPNGDYIPPPEIVNFNNQMEQSDHNTYGSWATPSLEDPLRLPDITDSDSNILSNLFNSNTDRAKDLGFTTSDTEFINLDRVDASRGSNAMQVYNSSASTMVASNPLDSLSNLPMQQLAQQVSRLQPNGNNGMHQQNVLINIQQFPQAPQQPPHAYQPHMYPHPPQPMYHQPYQYQPPNPYMGYPQPPVYPQHMPPPPRPQLQPQLVQPNQQMQPQQQQQQQQQPPQQQQHQYRQPAPPRQQQPNQPRQMQPGQRPQMQPRAGVQQMGGPRQFNPRQPMQSRQRAPLVRGRGGMPPQMMGQRGPRPRIPMQNPQQQPQQNGQRMMKRTPENIQALQAKKRKMDVLVPDKNDDGDCEVIAVQPKNTGLPQIQSIQGNVADPVDNSIMHLSDSITLSVRNPPPKPASPKKSDAKAVANILATRGITVTAAPKSHKETRTSSKSPEPAPPVAINLNSSVCIIPTKTGNKAEKLATVDLTDDTPDPPQQKSSPQKPTTPNKVLPFQCDLCPAKYPNSLSLNKHRQSYHKTGPNGDYGIPLIDLKSPGITQRLASLGIYNYIPLPNANNQSTFALPIISANAAQKNTNLNAIGATSVLTLGPIRTFPKAQQANHK